LELKNRLSDENLDHDVIIIGGGPGGSTAGYLLCKSGLDVLIIDKEKFPRPKLCGGLVSLKTLDLLYQIFGETPSSLYKKGIFNYITQHHEINYKFQRYITKNKSPIPFFYTDRTIYDNFLFEKAKEAGAKVLEGENIKKVDITSRHVTLSNDKEIKSKFLIGADGANSIVRQEFIKEGLVDQKKIKYNMATGLEVYIDRKLVNDGYFDHPILIFGVVKWGYAWIFPNKDRLVIGLGALNRKNKGNFKAAINKILKIIKVDPKTIDKIHGHPVPYGNFIYEPVFDNKVILIGDAGCYVDPLFGEGLYFSSKTAEFASLAIQKYQNKENLIGAYYKNRVYTEILPLLRNFMRLRWFCYNKMNICCKFLPIQLIIKLIENQFLEIINGVRPFRLWKKQLDIREVLLRK
jgi:geranylgeranyl reductase family protein